MLAEVDPHCSDHPKVEGVDALLPPHEVAGVGVCLRLLNLADMLRTMLPRSPKHRDCLIDEIRVCFELAVQTATHRSQIALEDSVIGAKSQSRPRNTAGVRSALIWRPGDGAILVALGSNANAVFGALASVSIKHQNHERTPRETYKPQL
jgi:hypothetical protein